MVQGLIQRHSSGAGSATAPGIRPAPTERFKKVLDELGIPMHRMIVNGIVPENTCPFCRSRRKMQVHYLEAIHKRFGSDLQVIEMPLFPFEMKGQDAIRQYAGSLGSHAGEVG